MNKYLLKGKIAEKNLTQCHLASQIGISESSLNRGIQGKREFRLSEVMAICEILGIENPISIFFDDNVPNMQRNEM